MKDIKKYILESQKSANKTAIEKILSKAQYDHKLMFAIIWASLSINAPAIWSGCFKFSQYSLLLLSLFFFFNRKETGEKYVFVKNDVR